jgi:hypothetical protein
LSVYRLIKIHRVREISQSGNPINVIGFFSNDVNAELAARNNGPNGSHGEVKIVSALQIIDTGEIFVLDETVRGAVKLDPELAIRRADLRREGLAKLSPLEREALGIIVTREDEEED